MAESALERSLLLARTAREPEGDALAQALMRLEMALEEVRAAQHLPAAVVLLEHVDAFEDSGEPVIVLDMAGYLTGWNKGAEAMFGYTREEAIGRHVLFLYADEADDAVAELFLERGAGVIEARRRKKNGELIWVRLALSIIDDDGQPAGMLVQLSPALSELTEEEKIRLHARIIEDSDQGILITDARERIVSVNSSFTRITGYSAAESIGQTPDLLRSGRARRGISRQGALCDGRRRAMARRDCRQAQERRAVSAIGDD